MNSTPNEPSNANQGRLHAIRTWFVSPLSKVSRGLLAVGGIVLPILCHLSTIDGLPLNIPSWQSGHLKDRVAFILMPQAGYVFYPFMALAMVALARYVFSSSSDRHHRWIGFGIINGAAVSLWYLSIYLIVLTGQERFDPASTLQAIGTFALLTLIPALLWTVVSVAKWIFRRIGISPVIGGIVLASLYVFLFALVVYLREPDKGVVPALSATVIVPWVLGIWFAPLWSSLTYTLASVRWVAIDRRARQFSLLHMMGLMTYIATLITTCRTSIRLALEAYLQLPLEQPSQCYVATAASMGHRSFVGKRPSGTEHEGRPGWVNHQVQVLKGFEIALATLLPAAHRRLRQVYNVVGPPLARRIDNPWKADVAYLALKPAEWFAKATLLMLLGRERRMIKRLYFAKGTPRR